MSKSLFVKTLASALALSVALVSTHAFAAKRLGGGGSAGKQSNNVTQRQAASATPGAPANAAQSSAAKPAAAAAAAPAAAAKKPWGAMLGGIAAGLGLAWLASKLGMGEAFGNIMMILLFAMLAFFAFRFFMARRQGGQGNSQAAAFAGSGTQPTAFNPQPQMPTPSNATQFEGNANGYQAPAAQAQPQGGSIIGRRLSATASTWNTPAGFDVAGFEQAAKAQYSHLQAAWDNNDQPALKAMMTDDLFAQIKAQLDGRTEASNTQVLSLNAQFLGIEESDVDYLASVEFTGQVNDSGDVEAVREVWNMSRTKGGLGGWLVAGIQH